MSDTVKTTEQVVREYYDAVDAGEIPALLDLFAHDAVYHRPGYEPLKGRSEIEHFYRDERVIVAGMHTIDDIVVDGDRAAVRGEFNGTLKDHSTAQEGFADFFVLDNGLIAQRRTYFDRAAV